MSTLKKRAMTVPSDSFTLSKKNRRQAQILVTDSSKHLPEIAESGLHSYERQFRLMVEAVTDYAIFMLDPKGQVVSWNKGARRPVAPEWRGLTTNRQAQRSKLIDSPQM